MVDDGPRMPRLGDPAIRFDAGGARTARPRTAEPMPGGSAPRGMRIPTLRQIASLVVDGVLTLPRSYRRGSYLDLLI